MPDIALRFLTDYTPASDTVRAKLDAVRDAYAAFATRMSTLLPDNAEKEVGFRKLLEAKDCHVRALL